MEANCYGFDNSEDCNNSRGCTWFNKRCIHDLDEKQPSSWFCINGQCKQVNTEYKEGLGTAYETRDKCRENCFEHPPISPVASDVMKRKIPSDLFGISFGPYLSTSYLVSKYPNICMYAPKILPNYSNMESYITDFGLEWDVTYLHNYCWHNTDLETRPKKVDVIDEKESFNCGYKKKNIKTKDKLGIIQEDVYDIKEGNETFKFVLGLYQNPGNKLSEYIMKVLEYKKNNPELRYIICPLTLVRDRNKHGYSSEYIEEHNLANLDDEPHANMLIIDTNKHGNMLGTVELFEPNGDNEWINSHYGTKILHEWLRSYFNKIDFEFISPKDIKESLINKYGMSDVKGLQVLEDVLYGSRREILKRDLELYYGGWCLVISTFYVDYRMSHPNLSTLEAHHKLINSFTSNSAKQAQDGEFSNLSLFIHNYANRITRDRAKILDGIDDNKPLSAGDILNARNKLYMIYSEAFSKNLCHTEVHKTIIPSMIMDEPMPNPKKQKPLPKSTIQTRQAQFRKKDPKRK